MQGRILGVKKSYILTSMMVVLSATFVALTLVSILLFNMYYLWFFIFCACCGLYQFLKGVLFKFDSAFFFGVLLICIAGVGFYVQFSGKQYFESVFYILAFAVASYLTFIFFQQKFHLYFSIMLYFVSFEWLLTKIKVLSIPIFVAICVASVIIFILCYTLVNKHFAKRKRR